MDARSALAAGLPEDRLTKCFSKYVVDKQGKITAFFPSDVTPEDPKLRGAIAKALAN